MKIIILEPADPSCRPGFFSCDGSRCHPLSRLCDAHQDCYDGTDESNCTNSINRIYQVRFICKFIIYLLIINIFI